jgi:hypothetical protein
MQSYILFAAIAHLLSRLQGGKGSFESTLSVLGFTYSIPLIILFWFPDAILFFSFGLKTWLALVPFYGIVAGLWTLFLSAFGLKISQQIGIMRALLVTLISMVISNILVIILIR